MKLILSDISLDILNNEEYNENLKYIDLSSLKIANCTGCFSCWTKTPGMCVIRDDAVNIYPLIAKSDELIYISHIKYGSYDTVMKTMLERAIPIQKAFIRLYKGETHHIQRDVTPKKATIIAYGNISEEEKNVFKDLVSRNAYNMNFENFKIIFTIKNKLIEIVEKEVLR